MKTAIFNTLAYMRKVTAHIIASWLRVESLHSFFEIVCKSESTQEMVVEAVVSVLSVVAKAPRRLTMRAVAKGFSDCESTQEAIGETVLGVDRGIKH